MSFYTTGSGVTLRTGPLLGKGGEGTVYSVEGNPQLAAKIYLPGLAAERRDKVAKMVSAKLHASTSSVAFPIDILVDSSGVFSGFTMRKMAGRKPVHQLYSPTSRKSAFPTATYPFLVRAVLNVARAMAIVHANGCIVGDINHSGVLVADDATVVLIDSDSFQFSYEGKVYPCNVGVPEFTPPELQGRSLANLTRTTSHDGFGLAVLIFYTLMMGRHPFAGRYLGSGDMPMERAIAECRFAYSARQQATQMAPPPNVPSLKDFPISLADAFELAFGPAGVLSGRRSATAWTDILEKAERELILCAHSSAHNYFRVAPSCPWCKMENAVPGFLAFVPVYRASPVGSTVDLGQLIAAARGVPDPGSPPDLAASMPSVVVLQADQSVSDLRKARTAQLAAAVTLGMVGVACQGMAAPIPLIGIFILALSCVVAVRPPAQLTAFYKRKRDAKQLWNDAKNSFEQRAGNANFREIKQEAERQIQALQDLTREESRRLSELGAKQRDAQLRRYLEAHDIEQVRIKGIGSARKVTLKAYGIETAADITYQRIVSIRGFGASTANSLSAWRHKLEASFRFDPNQGINPTDIVAIKADIARRQTDTVNRLRQAVDVLQKISSDALKARSDPGQEAIEAWSEWKQAEADEKAIAASPARLIPFIVVFVGAIAALAPIKRPAPAPQKLVRESRAINSLAVPQPQIAESADKKVWTPPAEAAVTPPLTPSPTTTESVPPSPANTSLLGAKEIPLKPEQPPTPTPSPTNQPSILSPTKDVATSRTSEAAGPSAAPTLLPFDLSTVPNVSSPLPPEQGFAPNLYDLNVAKEVQERLKLLGYFSGLPNGIWGSKSRAALRQFRHAQGLGDDDRWDTATQATLGSDRAVRAGSFAQIDSGATEFALPPPVGTTRNPLNKPDALFFQRRLFELGFYPSMGDGVWGLAARDALRKFKAFNQLPADDNWDAATEQLLSGSGQTEANPAFAGSWAVQRSDCDSSGSPPPVLISSRQAESLDTVCEFRDVRREGSSWWVDGRCRDKQSDWKAQIKLTLDGATLTWSSQRGTARYFRCKSAGP